MHAAVPALRNTGLVRAEWRTGLAVFHPYPHKDPRWIDPLRCQALFGIWYIFTGCEVQLLPRLELAVPVSWRRSPRRARFGQSPVCRL